MACNFENLQISALQLDSFAGSLRQGQWLNALSYADK
jgi:hypothetical protein